MQTDDFTNWLSAAAIGDTLVYYEGFLARDRVDQPDEISHGKVAKPGAPKVPGLHELALAVVDAEEAGKVALFQRRVGVGKFEYVAVRVAQRVAYRHRPSLSALGAGKFERRALAAE